MGSNNNWIRQDPIMIRLIRLLISKHKQVSWVGQKSYPPLSQVDDRKEEGSWGSKVNAGLYSLSSIQKKKKSNHIRIGFLCLMHFPSLMIQPFRKLGQNVAVLSDEHAPYRHGSFNRGEGWYWCPYRHACVSRSERWYRCPYRHACVRRDEGWYWCPYSHERVSRDEGWKKTHLWLPIEFCLSTVYAKTSLSSNESLSRVSVPAILRLFSFIWMQV